MICWLAIWALGAIATLYCYYAKGRDMYRPHSRLYIRKPYRMLFRDWAWIIFAWPLAVAWASFTHIKQGWRS